MYRVFFLAIFVLTATAGAQESDPQSEAATETETETVAAPAEDESEDSVLDSQDNHTEEDEDVFKPTDDVTYQQSVTFPVDI